jgi:hypothetical protein
MPSSRVDLESTGGSALCGNPVITIKRTFPTNIDAQLSESQWEEFCNQIDSVLEPLGSFKKRNSRVSCYLLIAALVLLILTPLVIKAMWMEQVFGNFWIVAMFGVMSTPLFGICYLVTRSKQKDLQIFNDLYLICAEATDRHPGISFILRRERVYTNAKKSAIVKYFEIVVASIHDPPRGRRTPETMGASSGHSIASGEDLEFISTVDAWTTIRV